MKNLRFTFIITIILIITACSPKDVIIENNSNNVDGDLNGYLEVVDGNYTIDQVRGLKMNIKLKVIKKLEDGKKFSELRAELLDEQGMPLTGVGTFQLKYGVWAHADQIEKVENALKKGEGEIAVQLEYDSWGACGSDEALKLASKKAKAFSLFSKLEDEEDNSSTIAESPSENASTVVTSGGSENWDKLLKDYEAYTDKYIKLLKKASAGDMSAMTEYVEMLEKAQNLQESLENADDDMSAAQLQKFNEIQMKLINAASGL